MINTNYIEEFHHQSLLKIFKNVTTSYKYLFLKSLLYKLKQDNFRSNEYSISILSNIMLAYAWYPIKYFKISLGSQDQINKIIDEIKIPNNSAKNFEKIVLAIENQIDHKKIPNILRYVPYRLLTTFYEIDLQGIPDAKRNDALDKISTKTFDDIKPIYRFINKNNILIHPEWLEYFKNNYGIVEAWLSWEWLCYLQKNNPNALSLSQKLFRPNQRKSLGADRKVWSYFIANNKVQCIYTNKQLKADDFVLDHYLPWSFVTHNQAWNLIPVSKKANEEKSDNLPPENTIKKFIDLQYRFLNSLIKSQKNTKYLDNYESHLKINEETLSNPKTFESKYYEVINPLLAQAKNMGFKIFKT